MYTPAEIPTRIDRALEIVEPGSVEEGQLLISAGWFAGTHEGDYQRARAALDRALEIA